VTEALARLTAALSRSYRLERQLGQGGMATVYLAQDIRHNRRVAVKVLRPELAAVIGAERFLSEITTTANLQHPHILPLFDSGESDGFLFYVMPYVEGETVRNRISREKQLPIADAVRIATEVAAALDYAHRHGVIHRDIKPENILLHDGSALVADFGIALAVSTAGSRMTETGMSLGTPHYMSPEQAMGEREITARSDVYALGCVLYEMLTGDPPFTGSTAQAIVARVVTENPRPMIPQRQTIPPHVEAAVLTSLQKLPADRFNTAAEFSAALADKSYVSATQAGQWGSGAPDGRIMMRPSRLAVPLAVLAAIATIAAIWGWLRPEPPKPVSRYGLGFPAGQAPVGFLSLTSDGSRLVYAGPSADGRGQIWVKDRTQYAAVLLPGTEGSAGPAVSPDGQWVAFDQGGVVKKIPIGGGAAVSLADSSWGAVPAWLDDGSLVFTRQDLSIGRVSEAGGSSTIAWQVPDSLAGSGGGFFMAPLPGARGVIFTLCTNLCAGSSLWVLDLKSGKAKQLFPDARRGWYLPTGHIAYVRSDGGMFAAPFDLKSLDVGGTPVPILENVSLLFGIIPSLSFSQSGTLVMQVGSGGAQRGIHEMVWVDRTGRETPVDSSWSFRHALSNNNAGWALSPDGKRLAIALNTGSGDDIWIKELPTGPLMKITQDSTSEERPRWTPDGKSVTYIVDGASSLRRSVANGTGKPDIVLNTPGLQLLEGSYSRDGTWLLFRVGGNGGTNKLRNILAFRPGVDSAPVELLANAQADESAPALSPDGKWLAYVSDETGRNEVYIRPFPKVDDGKWQVSTNGAQAPLWAHSGRELFYVDADRNMMAVAVPAVGPSQLGARVKLFKFENSLYLTATEWYTPFDISPDDKRFIMSREVTAGAAEQPTFLLVENWFNEVKAKVRGN